MCKWSTCAMTARCPDCPTMLWWRPQPSSTPPVRTRSHSASYRPRCSGPSNTPRPRSAWRSRPPVRGAATTWCARCWPILWSGSTRWPRCWPTRSWRPTGSTCPGSSRHEPGRPARAWAGNPWVGGDHDRRRHLDPIRVRRCASLAGDVGADIEEGVAPQPARVGKGRRQLPSWRWEELRTTLWVVPSVFVVVAVLLFIVTFEIDVAAYHGHLTLPYWIRTGNADAERQVLIAIAAAVITVIGVVFSITILALTLASQQFGPRMMRNFVRDIGNQVTLGIFVGTFVYSVLALGSINSLSRTFVPHLSTSVAEALLLLDLGQLIYFIHHIAKSIQLPHGISEIAR